MQTIKVHDLDIEYEISYRNIKYPRLEFKTGNLLLILPKNYKDPEKLIKKHKNWIYNKISIIKDAIKKANDKNLNLERTEKEFKDLVKSHVKSISDQLNLKVNRIIFRKMKTKWGSCSPKGNITINTTLKYLPENLIEYVIFHEMAHFIERKHNKHFWNIISKKFKNYKKLEKDLLIYWFLIQSKNNPDKLSNPHSRTTF
ncbi:MAG: hypothetical protein PWQ74_389 [Methanobacteriaceae archaeon]|nr:hypothetical protein [Methanobacteriaceae archaeon]